MNPLSRPRTASRLTDVMREIRAARARLRSLGSTAILAIALAPIPAGALVTVGGIDFANGAIDVAVQGDLAYAVGELGGLRVIDVSDPAAPIVVGSIETGSNVAAVEVAGSFAYLPDSDGRLWIIDASTPALPTQAGIFDSGSSVDAYDVEVSNSIAYLAHGTAGLRVIDVSNPGAPVEIGRLDTPGSVRGIELSGGVAYLADAAGGLRIIDVSSPAAPVMLGSLAVGATVTRISVVDGIAYLGSNGVDIVNVSNPSAPIWLGSYEVDVSDIGVDRGLAYVTVSFGGIKILDVSDPTRPVEVNSTSANFLPNAVEPVGRFAYVATWKGLRIIDVTAPQYPMVVGRAGDSLINAIEIVEDLAYVLEPSDDGATTLRIIDVSNSSEPAEVGSIWIPEDSVDLKVTDGFAYVLTHVHRVSDTIRVFDVANPAEPREVGSWNLGSGQVASSFDVSAGIVYVSLGFDGMRVIDFTNPQDAKQINSIELTPDFREIAFIKIVDDRMYVSEGGWLGAPGYPGRATIYDISNPLELVERGVVSLDDGEILGSFFVDDGLMYAAVGHFDPIADVITGEVRVFDISNPTEVEVLGAFEDPVSILGSGIVRGPTIRGPGSLALLVQWDTAFVLDVSDPLATRPVEVAGVRTMDYLADIEARDELIYVVGGEGLQIIDLGPEFRIADAAPDAVQCHGARSSEGAWSLDRPSLSLVDSFGASTETAGGIRELCAPVGIDGAAVSDATAHLVCHDLASLSARERLRRRDQPPRVPLAWEPFDVVVDNEFGEDQILRVRAPEQLCARSSVELVSSGRAPGDSSELPLDHFQCYGVEASDALPGRDALALSDAFGDATRSLGRPTTLCAPVDVDGEGVIDADTYLTCYKLRNPDRRLQRERTLVRASNFLGDDQQLAVLESKSVCVPSELRYP